MGSYTDLAVNGYALISSKSYAVATVMTIFRETDKKIFTRNLSERNPMVWGTFSPEEDEVERAMTYECQVINVCDRLDVMGYTMKRCRDDYERIRHKQIEEYKSWREEDKDDWQESLVNTLEAVNFDAYLATLKKVIQSKEQFHFLEHEEIEKLDLIRKHIFSSEDFELGFFATDYRSLIRIACSVVPSDAMVVQDLTEVVDAGYYVEGDDVCTMSIKSLIEDHPENAARIILTEGSSDVEIIRKSIDALYPHLAEYYTFLEFSSFRAPGSAGSLVNTIKSFAAAGISNRIIAIFDNDSAAFDARRALTKIELPANIVVCNYPDTDFLSSYPTLGPSGRVDLDVNGLAASIELYLGENVLSGADGELSPVQWKGFIEGVGKYQGEVMHKGKIQQKFYAIISDCKKASNTFDEYDFKDLRALLKVIFNAFD